MKWEKIKSFKTQLVIIKANENWVKRVLNPKGTGTAQHSIAASTGQNVNKTVQTMKNVVKLRIKNIALPLIIYAFAWRMENN